MKHNPDIDLLNSRLDSLRLPFLKEQCQPVAATAAKNSITHLAYLQQLIEGEAALRDDRAVARRIQAARFPVIKTLDSFRWDWPKKSTGSKSRTSSVFSSFMIKPTSSC